jgi:hypothetical protein
MRRQRKQQTITVVCRTWKRGVNNVLAEEVVLSG